MSRIVTAVLICGISLYIIAGVPFAGGSLRLFAAAETARKPELQPGLPARNPALRKAREIPVSAKGERDRMLCRALQACRDGFIACKGKIEHADQSEAWSIAKEECGAHYKTCVAKDFRAGEWFFTRWFYFKKLNCE